MFADSFRGRRALITGHTGFKGSWLAIWLSHLGAVVSGLALDPPTSPSNFEASGVHALLTEDARADIRDRSAVAASLARCQPEVVFHLAAQPIVRVGLADPLGTIDVNVRGTATVLDAVREAARPCVVVVVTSDKCYEAANSAHVEEDRLGGAEPYGASKAAAEMVVDAYRSSYFPAQLVGVHGVRVASVRAGNVIGGGDWSTDRIFPDLARAVAGGSDVLVRSPRAVRPWQHVLAPLSGYLALAARLLEDPEPAPLCGAWNFGPSPDAARPVQALVETALARWGAGPWRRVQDDLVEHEAAYLALDSEKAARLLHWRGAWDFEQSVSATVDWYRKFYAERPKSMLGPCLADIERYMLAWSETLVAQGA